MVIFPISIFSQIRSEGGGGVIKYHFFPKFKIVHIILGGGGVKKIMDFFHNLWDFFLDCSPYSINLRQLVNPTKNFAWAKTFQGFRRPE